MSRASTLVASTVLAVSTVLAACTGGNPDSTPTTSSVVTTTSPVTTTLPVVASLADSLFSTLAGRTPTALVDAAAFTVPGSPAALFVDHRLAAGALVDDPPAVATPTGGGYRVCGSADSCVTYDAVVVDPATGRVSSFAIDGATLDGRIVGPGLAVDVEGVIARVRSAYVTSAGDLSVLVEVSNTTEAGLELFAFAAAYQPESSGAAVEAMGWWGQPVVPAGSDGLLLLAFPDVRPAGVVRLTGWRDDAIDVALDLRVRPAG